MAKFTLLEWCSNCNDDRLIYDASVEACPTCHLLLDTMAYPQCVICGYDIHPADSVCAGCNASRNTALGKQIHAVFLTLAETRAWPAPQKPHPFHK